ncbi:hypothetical protein [Fluviicola sp.]|uniref:hypothetical protein n=1 Tax=Fluviicola sp. TaxID=1917219 RepID=UPI00260503DC|nr:hypothetical protein [Fluviicola sp.]
MRWLPLLFLAFFSFGQKTDTISGYQFKISGEELVYYSPYDRFAKTALLTRCNGNSPVKWNAGTYKGKQKMVTYELLIGHSTGTSSGSRDFILSLNDLEIGTLTTHPQQKGKYSYSTGKSSKGSAEFVWMEYDANNDGFGKLYITVPASSVKQQAVFSILGTNANSRDWLMVFMYQRTFKVDVESTQLVTRKENKRQLNLYIDQPLSQSTILHVKSNLFDTTFSVSHGYNKLSLPVYPVDFNGTDEIDCSLSGVEGGRKVKLEIEPLKSFEFHIIHHSHNDIGYSHLQTEVAEIQTKNIRTALEWIRNTKPTQQPYWHIESLWAVENFLGEASESEKQEFFTYVKRGNIILSANYANILTGLSRPEELNWMLEYSRLLEENNSIDIQCAMITDIPGITAAGLNAYVQNDIPYLSLGPNYVEAFADHGDRVGGVIHEQGDKAFYWKPDLNSDKKVLVWTAGKGYSFFHNVGDKQKQERWEQKISDYCIELDREKYPYEIVQLRYTKKADNGPVDTDICNFIDNWNATYSTPKLVLSSVNNLFSEFEKRYGSTLPVETGEISPYWEDGAFSTVVEEILNRTLSFKTAALETKARKDGSYDRNKRLFYALHRNILLFNEHTWGAWCSISDPEAYFTTEQWKIKKSFVDSARTQYDRLEKIIGAANETTFTSGVLPIDDFKVDSKTGGISELISLGKNLFREENGFNCFEPVYSLGIKPQTIQTPNAVDVSTVIDNTTRKEVLVKVLLGESVKLEIDYLLDKQKRLLHVRYKVNKELVKDKESMHIALPLSGETTALLYGTSTDLISFSKDQLPGSNREFICTDKELLVKTTGPAFRIYSPQLNLFEVGGIINEQQVNGAKVWKKESGDISRLFLYVFNNYWHTNYKAYQEGFFEFELILGIE